MKRRNDLFVVNGMLRDRGLPQPAPGMQPVRDALKLAVFRAVYTEVNARIQQQAHQLGGDYRTLDDEEARLADEANSGQVDRPWQLWAEAARQRRA